MQNPQDAGTIRFSISDICSAFNKKAIGSRVIDVDGFFGFLSKAVKEFDWKSCRAPGQAKIFLPKEAYRTVSCGVGLRVDNPDYYVLRAHRGKVSCFLKRNYAEATGSLAVVVYTSDAFLKDPEVNEDEAEAIRLSLCTHVIVAVLAGVVDNPTMSAYRFVSNLGGGNNEALLYSADEIRKMAKEIISNENKYITVAD